MSENRMRIVIDTNVYLSNFIFGGFTSKVCSDCFETQEVFISEFIKKEISQKLLEKFKYPLEKTKFVLKTIELVTQEVVPTNLLPDVCRDKDDNAVLQLCQFVNAEFLITGDKDLLILENFKSTRIVTPRLFFEAMNL